MAMYHIHQELLVANKVNGRIYVNLEEGKEKENMFFALHWLENGVYI